MNEQILAWLYPEIYDEEPQSEVLTIQDLSGQCSDRNLEYEFVQEFAQ